MQITAQQLFKELDSNKWRAFYFVVGEELFQASEILARLKSFFIKDSVSGSFNYEAWDGEHLDAGAMLASLDTLPGLFSDADAIRLVVCRNFDKVSSYGLECLEKYFKNPSPTTCFVGMAAKIDKRKGWYKAVGEEGGFLEVAEPYEREWPKWHSYLERKVGKKIDTDAWEMLVLTSGKSLSILWAELQKTALFAGDASRITARDVQVLASSPEGTDVFALADDVLNHHSFGAIKKFHELVRSGESEIKILSILVRQFRLVERYLDASKNGITDSKAMASHIGVHPFFVSKVAQQSKKHTPASLKQTIHHLATCDYRLKTGEGGVFEHFLVPYFQKC